MEAQFTDNRGRPSDKPINAAKLNPEKVRDIRARWRAGESIANLAREHSLNPSSITRICRGLSWKHVQ